MHRTSPENNTLLWRPWTQACGVCKEAAQRFEALRREVVSSRSRIVLVKHNIMTPYDDVSDISRWHKVRAVPAFLFIDDGAVVSGVPCACA